MLSLKKLLLKEEPEDKPQEKPAPQPAIIIDMTERDPINDPINLQEHD